MFLIVPTPTPTFKTEHYDKADGNTLQERSILNLNMEKTQKFPIDEFQTFQPSFKAIFQHVQKLLSGKKFRHFVAKRTKLDCNLELVRTCDIFLQSCKTSKSKCFSHTSKIGLYFPICGELENHAVNAWFLSSLERDTSVLNTPAFVSEFCFQAVVYSTLEVLASNTFSVLKRSLSPILARMSSLLSKAIIFPIKRSFTTSGNQQRSLKHQLFIHFDFSLQQGVHSRSRTLETFARVTCLKTLRNWAMPKGLWLTWTGNNDKLSTKSHGVIHSSLKHPQKKRVIFLP